MRLFSDNDREMLDVGQLICDLCIRHSKLGIVIVVMISSSGKDSSSSYG